LDTSYIYQCIDKKPSRVRRVFSMLANPFQKIAGLYALMGGLAIIICMSSTHFFLVVLSKPYYLVSNDFPFYYFL
jgi:hypothetical protein